MRFNYAVAAGTATPWSAARPATTTTPRMTTSTSSVSASVVLNHQTIKMKELPLNRLLRGGSWLNYPRSCRSAYRSRDQADYANFNVGFRVCCIKPQTHKMVCADSRLSLRGGAYCDHPRLLRSSLSYGDYPGVAGLDISFRVTCFCSANSTKTMSTPIAMHTRTEEFRHELIGKMIAYGGSFARSLALAMQNADSENFDRIARAFPEIVDRYINL